MDEVSFQKHKINMLMISKGQRDQSMKKWEQITCRLTTEDDAERALKHE